MPLGKLTGSRAHAREPVNKELNEEENDKSGK